MFKNEVKCASCDATYYAVSEVRQTVGYKAPPCGRCDKDTVLVIKPGLKEY